MIYLLKKCSLVITDSGGLQKEAFYFGKYCVTSRDETEWTELVKTGYNVLAGSSTSIIIETANSLLMSAPIKDQSLYGDGKTSEKIIEVLMSSME